MAKALFIILLIGLSATGQSFGFSIFGVKPNLVLVMIVTVPFFISNFWQGILIISLAALILKFSPGFESEILILSLIGIGAMLIKKYLPWRYFFSNLVLIILGTFIFYFWGATNLILTTIFLKELILNLIGGMLIFVFLDVLWQNK